MKLSFDDRILIALYKVAVKNASSGGYRITELMPEGSSLQDGRDAAMRLEAQGYLMMPQEMCVSPIIYITEQGCSRALLLLSK